MTKPLPYTLVLRKVKRNMTSHRTSHYSTSCKGFKYPDAGYVGVSSKEWDPTPRCGGGLHGLAWAHGSYETIPSRIRDDSHGKWLVIKVLNKNLVEIPDDCNRSFIEKVKFKCGHVIYKGNKKDAIKLILADSNCPFTKTQIQNCFDL